MSEFDRLAATRNHFDLFDLPVRFTLDRQFFERKYLELTRATHPDLAGTGPEQQLAAMQLSARVNEAYATLGDDLKRAEYMLQMRGQRTGDARLGPATMDRIFELRESLSAAQVAGDDEEAEKAKAGAAQWLSETMAQLREKLDRGEGGEEVLELVSTARYLQKIASA